jgi:hypothetical protein
MLRLFSQADFSISYRSLKCLIACSPSELWKLHRRLGHISFNLLCRLSGLALIQGLLKLTFENDLTFFIA